MFHGDVRKRGKISPESKETFQAVGVVLHLWERTTQSRAQFQSCLMNTPFMLASHTGCLSRDSSLKLLWGCVLCLESRKLNSSTNMSSMWLFQRDRLGNEELQEECVRTQLKLGLNFHSEAKSFNLYRLYWSHSCRGCVCEFIKAYKSYMCFKNPHAPDDLKVGRP